MRRTLTGLILATTFTFAATAQAVTVDPDGAGAAGSFELGSFQWKVGNAISVDSAAAIADFVADGTQTPFQTFYQASLVAFLDTDGNQVATPGLNTAYQWTISVGFVEQVTSVLGSPPLQPGQASATFALVDAAPNFFEIYQHGAATADDLSGEGFRDGTVVLSGEVTSAFANFFQTSPDAGDFDSFQSNEYTDIRAIGGTGSLQVVTNVDSAAVNPLFLSVDPGLVINTAITNSTQTSPFTEANPSLKFWDGSGDYAPGFVAGDIVGNNTADFQFQANASSSLTVIPEPATAALGLMGLAALAAGIRRRR